MSNHKMIGRPSLENYGPGAAISYQSIYEESATAKHRIGERLRVGDRTFRYASAGTALVAGFLVEGATKGGATTTTQTTVAVTVASKVDDSYLYVCALTTVQAANVFADGWAIIHDDSTGGCFTVRVKGNTSLATSGTTSYVELYDGLYVALTTSDQVELMANPFKNVVAMTAAGSGLVGAPLGVAPRAVTSGYYFWLQTAGPCACVPTTALDFDEAVAISSAGAAGEVDLASASTGSVVGWPWHIGTAAEGALVNLRILD